MFNLFKRRTKRPYNVKTDTGKPFTQESSTTRVDMGNYLPAYYPENPSGGYSSVSDPSSDSYSGYDGGSSGGGGASGGWSDSSPSYSDGGSSSIGGNCD